MASGGNGKLIRLEGVKKVFFTDEVETHALSDIHLEVDRGEYLSIAGPSGCGKTTLLSLLGLLDTPTEGHYWLNSKETAGLTAGELRRVVAHAVRHADALERLLHALLALAAGHAAIGERQLDVLEHRQVADQVECLEDEADLAVADPGPLDGREPCHLLAGEQVLAGGR